MGFIPSLIPAPYQVLAKIAAVAIFLLSLYAYAHHQGAKSVQAKFDAYKAKETAAVLKAEQEAKTKGDALISSLQTQQTLSTQLAKAKHHALLKSVPSVCFDSYLLGMLNAGSEIELSKATTGVNETSPGASSSTVAGWIIDAQGLYDDCASRLTALQDFIK